MKISKLIEKLEKMRQEHGDIAIRVYPYDGQSKPDVAKTVIFQDGKYHWEVKVRYKINDVRPYILIE